MTAGARPGRFSATLRAVNRRVARGWRVAHATVLGTRITRARLASALSEDEGSLDARVCAWRTGLGARLPAGPLDADPIRDILAAHAPEQLAALVRRADRAASRRFEMLGSGEVDLGTPIDWHADFKSGYRWPSGRHHVRVSIDSVHGADVKVPWELSRGHHLPLLAQAALLTNDDRYAREAVVQIREWIAANPPQYGVNWVSAMDVALRAVNWLWTAALLSKHPAVDDGFFVELLASLLAHGLFIEANLEDPPDGIRTNHYLADLLGLLYIGACCPELARARWWREFAREELRSEIESQVLPDGVSYESSIPYHRLVTEIFLSAAAVEARNGRPFDARFESRLSAMLEFVRAYTKPDGRAPQIGDADDGRVHVLSSREATPEDHRHLLAAGAAILGRDDWWQASGPRWTEGLWFGAAHAGRGEPPRAAAAPESRAFPDAGLYILRHAEDMVVMSAGRVGTAGLGNHKHNDVLAIDVHLGGEDVLVDPGTYLYTADPVARDAFRSTLAHNTVSIDSVEQNEFRALFALASNAVPRLVAWEPTSEGGRVIAEHDGYMRLPAPIVHRRSVTLDAAGVVSVNDTFDGTVGAAHRFTWTFAFAPGCTLAACSEGWVVTLPSQRTVRLAWPTDGAGARLDVSAWQGVGFVSPSYGVRVPAPVLRWEWCGAAPASVTLSLRPTGPLPRLVDVAVDGPPELKYP